MPALTGFIHDLPLPAMFLLTLACGALLGLVIAMVARLVLRPLGFGPNNPFALRESTITATSAIFALMIAFSAAGIWNDAIQARTAVQREANALENIRSLAESLPADLRESTMAAVQSYVRAVVEQDWPAMARRVEMEDAVYTRSETILVGLIDMIARELAKPAPLPGAGPLIGQIVEARSARLERITLASAGVSGAQWVAIVLIAAAAITGVAIGHNHDIKIQIPAMTIYVVAVSAAFFVILAHDRPFVGKIAVSAAPIAYLIGR